MAVIDLTATGVSKTDEKLIDKLIKGKEIKEPRKVLRAITVIIPQDVEDFLREVAYETGDEFGVLLKGKLDPKTFEFTIDSGENLENVFIPEQQGSPAHLSFLSHCPEEFNVVVHRHPEGCLNFSKTDDDSINREFELSLLFVPSRGFVTGVYNFNFSNKDQPCFQVKAEIVKASNSRFKNKVNELLSKKQESPRNYIGGFPNERLERRYPHLGGQQNSQNIGLSGINSNNLHDPHQVVIGSSLIAYLPDQVGDDDDLDILDPHLNNERFF